MCGWGKCIYLPVGCDYMNTDERNSVTYLYDGSYCSGGTDGDNTIVLFDKKSDENGEQIIQNLISTSLSPRLATPPPTQS